MLPRINRSSLEAQYWGQWIAIINQTVIETADTESELLKRLEERKLRRFTTTIQSIGDLRPIPDLITLDESDRLEFKRGASQFGTKYHCL